MSNLASKSLSFVDMANPVNWNHPLNHKRSIFIYSPFSSSVDGGSTWYDLCGKNHASLTSGTWTSTPVGQGISFNAGTSVATVSNPPVLNNTNGYTVTGLYKASIVDGDWRTLVDKSSLAASNRQIFVGQSGGFATTTNSLCFFSTLNGDGGRQTSFTLTTGEWYWFAAVHSGTSNGNFLYVGTLNTIPTLGINATQNPASTTMDADNGTNSLLIGNYKNFTSTRNVGGPMLYFSLWERPLSYSEVIEEWDQTRNSFPDVLNYRKLSFPSSLFYSLSGDNGSYSLSGQSSTFGATWGVGTGTYVVTGTDIDAENLGEIEENLLFTADNEDASIQTTSISTSAASLPQATSTITTDCTTALFPLAFEFKHELDKIKFLSDFLRTNDYSLPGASTDQQDFIKLNYSQRNGVWQSSLHYAGQSVSGNYQEYWNLGFEFGCVNGSWLFTITLGNTKDGRKTLSRAICKYSTEDVCPEDAFFGFDFLIDFDAKTSSPSFLQPIVLNDQSGFFRNLQSNFQMRENVVLPQVESQDNTLPYNRSIEIGRIS